MFQNIFWLSFQLETHGNNNSFYHFNSLLLYIFIAFDKEERILIMSFFEISPVGFTRRSCVYRRDAIRFQGFVEIERTSLIFDYY